MQDRKNRQKNHHLDTIAQLCRAIGISSQLRHMSTIGKNVKQQCLFHMSSQYDKFWSTNGWDPLASLGHPSKFQRVSRLGFVTAATSLNGSQPNFARCLAVSWAGALYIHFRGLLPRRNFATCKIHFASKSCALLLLAALLHGTQVVGVSQTVALSRGRHLYAAGRPSRWALAHILVENDLRIDRSPKPIGSNYLRF